MTPTELRRAATEVKSVVTEGLYLCQEPREAFAATIAQLCDHLLATVREDDGELLDLEFVKIQPLTRYHAGTLYLRGGLDLEVCSNNHDCKPCYLTGRDGLLLETRGQLRRLLEGLGVDSAK